jgi:hypothetical protein
VFGFGDVMLGHAVDEVAAGNSNDEVVVQILFHPSH